MAEEEPSKSDSEEPKPSGSEKPSGKLGDLKALIIGSIFTLLGGLIGVLGKGCYDLKIEDKKVNSDLQLELEKSEGERKLERQKLDADLVKLALQGTEDTRRDTLGFMVETNLIADPDIQKGVKSYLASNKPLPQFPPSFVGDRYSIESENRAKKLKASANVSERQLSVLDQKTDSVLFTDLLPIRVKFLFFSPDGSKLMAADQNEILIWNTEVGKLTSSIKLSRPLDSVEFSEDGNKLIVRRGQEQEVIDEFGNKVGP